MTRCVLARVCPTPVGWMWTSMSSMLESTMMQPLKDREWPQKGLLVWAEPSPGVLLSEGVTAGSWLMAACGPRFQESSPGGPEEAAGLVWRGAEGCRCPEEPHR